MTPSVETRELRTLADLSRAVSHYCSRYHIMPFEISEAYEVHENWSTHTFPHANKCGCYAFFDREGALRYIGKASCGSTIGRRADTYFKAGNEGLAPTRFAHWGPEVSHLYTIPVHEAHQAPSLEEYLIETLNPPDNCNARRDHNHLARMQSSPL